MKCEFGHAGVEELADGGEATSTLMRRSVGWVWRLIRPCFSSGRRCLRRCCGEADGFAKLLEAEAVGAYQGGHDQAVVFPLLVEIVGMGRTFIP